MSRVLDVYLHEELAGKLNYNEGKLVFTYIPAYVRSGRPALSYSLPLRDEEHKGEVVEAFFAGLLPDESLRVDLAHEV